MVVRRQRVKSLPSNLSPTVDRLTYNARHEPPVADANNPKEQILKMIGYITYRVTLRSVPATVVVVENKNHYIVLREKTNKMQQLDVYYQQLLSQHVSGIIMPIFRRTKAQEPKVLHILSGCV